MSAATEGMLVEIPISQVYPDPFQPRLHPDAELAASIKSVGQLQPIRVERAQPIDAIDVETGKTFVQIAAESGYMIQDGERRYRGLRAAGKRSVMAVIVPPATEGQRLLRQLVANTGKPLSPVEEARAFKRIMESEGWSANRLAQELGRPRSTIGDRVRVLELDPAWLDLMDRGVLQLSHAAILHPYAAVPHKYQVAAAKEMAEVARASTGGPLTVQEVEEEIFGCFDESLMPLSEVPGYRGPVVEIKPYLYGTKAKYAADPDLWRPLVKTSTKKSSRASSSSSYSYTPRAPWAKSLPAGVRERTTSSGYADPQEGEVQVMGSQGWEFYHGNDGDERPFDPRVLLERAAPESFVKVTSKFSIALMATDTDALQAARDAFEARVAAVYAERTATAREALERAVGAQPLQGAGCAGLARWALRMAAGIHRESNPIDVAQILGLADPALLANREDLFDMWDDDSGDEREADAVTKIVADMTARGTLETFCASVAALPTLDVEVPSYDKVRRELVNECQKAAPEWPGAADSTKKRRKKGAAAADDVERAIATSVEPEHDEDLDVDSNDVGVAELLDEPVAAP